MDVMTRSVSTALLLAVSIATVSARGSAVAEEKLGAGVTLTEATPISALYSRPQEFVGKTIRVDGVVSAVCEAMGCWMALAADDKSTQTVRFKVDHEAGIVFPLKARGLQASAQGVFEKIGDAEGKEAAGEDKTASDFGKTYQIKATGAVIQSK